MIVPYLSTSQLWQYEDLKNGVRFDQALSELYDVRMTIVFNSSRKILLSFHLLLKRLIVVNDQYVTHT